MQVNQTQSSTVHVQNQINSIDNINNIDKPNIKINRRKSVLHQVLENSLIEKDTGNDTSLQVAEWMKLNSYNVNI